MVYLVPSRWTCRGDKLWWSQAEEEFATFINPYMARDFICEPVWPSGKDGKRVSGRTSVRYRFGSPFSSKTLWFADTVL